MGEQNKASVILRFAVMAVAVAITAIAALVVNAIYGIWWTFPFCVAGGVIGAIGSRWVEKATDSNV